jgi:hypothetical protein
VERAPLRSAAIVFKAIQEAPNEHAMARSETPATRQESPASAGGQPLHRFRSRLFGLSPIWEVTTWNTDQRMATNRSPDYGVAS